jgi:hypothetical protein
MPKGDSKVVNLRTDNTMANRKRQKDRQHNGQQKKDIRTKHYREN